MAYSASKRAGGAKTATQEGNRAARENLQLMLHLNLLKLAQMLPRQPNKAELYLQQSLLEDHPRGGDEAEPHLRFRSIRRLASHSHCADTCGNHAMEKPAAKPSTKLPPSRRRPFHRRFLGALGWAMVLIGCSLSLGVLGYHFIGGLRWVDALLDASMILSGMGPVSTLASDGAKVFASLYALFSGLMLIGATGIVLSPVFHRVLHKFHIEQGDAK